MAQAAPDSTTALSAGTSTKAALVKRVARRLDARAYEDKLTGGYSSGGTSLSVASDGTARYQKGGIVDFLYDDTYEAMVIEATATTSLTVRGAQFGTTAANHSNGAVFRYYPSSDAWLSHTLGELVEEAVNNLWPDLYTVYVSDYTVADPVEHWYALAANTEEVLDAYQVSSDAPVSVSKQPLEFRPHWFHSDFAASKKAVEIQNASLALTTLYVLTTQRVAITELSSAMQDIVVLDACRMALEADGMRKARRDDPFIFDITTKLQLLRREIREAKSREMLRLKEFAPQRDTMVFRQRRHYADL